MNSEQNALKARLDAERVLLDHRISEEEKIISEAKERLAALEQSRHAINSALSRLSPVEPKLKAV